MQKKDAEEQENDFIVVEFPNANSKVKSPIWATPDREAVTSESLNYDHFSTPTEVLDTKKTIATSAFTETQPSQPTDESRRSVGNRTASKIPLRGKAKTGPEAKAASTVNDLKNESLNGTGGNKRYKTRKRATVSVYTIWGLLVL